MPESYTKSQIEAALFKHNFNILQEEGSLTAYQTNFFPGGDLVIDWSREHYEWEDLQQQLEYQGIDPKTIHDYLYNH